MVLIICNSKCYIYICRTELAFVTPRRGELLLLSVPHTKIIFKRKDLKVIKYRVLNLHSFNAIMWQCPLCALPNHPTDRVEMWRAFGLLGFFLMMKRNLKTKAETCSSLKIRTSISRTVAVSVTWLESTISCYPTVLQMKPRPECY